MDYKIATGCVFGASTYWLMTADLARWSLETQPIISMCGYQQNRRTPEDRVVPENLKSTGDKMADARIVVLGEKKVGKSGEFRKNC